MRPSPLARLRDCRPTALLGGLVAVLACAPSATTTRDVGAPSAALNLAPLEQFAARLRSGEFGNADHLVILHEGRMVLDERFPRDYATISQGKVSPLGCGAGSCPDSASLHQYNYLHPRFHPWWQGGDLHTLQSVTKSVTATLIGIALARGEIERVDAPLLSFFDDYDLGGVDPRLRQATLADLLTMRSGIEWHETDRPFDSTNTTLQLEQSQDWIRFTLKQPMDAAPGTKWVYSSGGSMLMSEILRSATGMSADQYAEKYLFGPLGIRSFYWKATPTGHPDTEGGLYLRATDLARIGQLYLDDGVWKGKRLLPAGWAREATGRHVQHIRADTTSPGYGYQWWRYDRGDIEVWAGNGFGGQFLVVLPVQRMVGVVNAWNVFGERVPGSLRPMVDAMLEAAR